MATVYKTTADGVYKTTDNGNNWSDVTPDATYEYVDLVKKDDDTAYVLGNKDTAGTFASKIWKTTTAGGSWPTSAALATEVPVAWCGDNGTESSKFTSFYSTWKYGFTNKDLFIEIDTDKYVILYITSLTTYVRAFTVNPVTEVITYGDAVDIGAWAGSTPAKQGGGRLTKVDTNKFAVVFFHEQTANSFKPTVKIGTISGVTITLGSAQNLANAYEESAISGGPWWSPGSAIFCPSSSVIVVWRPAGEYFYTNGDDCDWGQQHEARWGTISGTAITWSEEGSCGNVDLETVGKYYALDGAGDAAATLKKMGSVGLVLYTDTDDGWVRVLALGSSEGSFSTYATVASEPAGEYVSTGLEAYDMCVLSPTKALAIWQIWYYEYDGGTIENHYVLYGAIVTVNGTATPTVGARQEIFDSRDYGVWPGDLNWPVWWDDVSVDALSSTRAVLSYFTEDTTGLRDYDCHGVTMLNISGNTITKDESCPEGMNPGAFIVRKESATEFMLLGRKKPWYPDPDWGGVIWAGVTADDVDACAETTLDYEARGISIAVSGDQQNAYVTFCDGASLQLTSLSANDLSEIRTKSLGEATMAEVASSIKIAYPTTTGIENDRLWVFGRMINPAGLAAASPVQIIRSQDAGQTFDIYQNGWGDDVCGAAFQRNTVAPFYSVRNFAGLGQAMFYTNKIATGGVPFHVHNRAMYIPRTQGYAILGGSDVQEQRLYYAVQPFTRWYNVTRNYPNTASSNGGAITGVTVI